MTDQEIEGAAPEKSLDEILGSSLSDAYEAAASLPDDDAGQPRNERGQWAPKGQAAEAKDTSQAAPDAPAAAPAAKPNTVEGQTSAAAPGTDPASEPPASLTAAEKALWPTLSPEVRSLIARREADFAKGIEQKAQGLKAYEGFEAIIGPRRQALAATYGSAENAISQLFKLSDFADQSPAEFAKWFLQARGLDPRTVFGGAANPAPQPGQQGHGADPATGLPPEIAAVRAEVDSLKHQLVQAMNAPIISKAQSDLQRFEAEAPTKFQHYATPGVKEAMAVALQNGPDDMTYEQAYERVIWSMPEIRQQLIESERQAALKAQTEEAAKAAAEARRKAGPQLRSVGAPAEMRASASSIDQTLSEAYDRLTGAA